MMRRLLAIAVLATCSASTRAQEASPSRPTPIDARVDGLTARLESLSPANPRAYFELGEEVAAEATAAEARRLASELYAMAFELSRANAEVDPTLPASACLGLAAIAETENERRWLSALAGTLGADPWAETSARSATTASRDPAAFDLATLLGCVRAGEGRRAARILEKPGVAELLERCDKILIPGLGGGAERIRRYITDWPICPECRNRRFTKGPEGVQLCAHCGGQPGPRISPAELLDEVRTEALLLSGVQRSWASQIITDGGAPLRDLDPAELAATYGVSASRPLWRSGAWSAVPPARPAAPGKPDQKSEEGASKPPPAGPGE